MTISPILAQESETTQGNFSFSLRNGEELDLQFQFECQTETTPQEREHQTACQGTLIKEDSGETSSLEAEGTFSFPGTSD